MSTDFAINDDIFCNEETLAERKCSLTSEIDKEEQSLIDAERLSQSLKEAVKYSYGVSAVEVWILNEKGQLVRPGIHRDFRSAGWFSNPRMPRNDALCQLDDPTHPNYNDPNPCPVDCDLAGVLYRDSEDAGLPKKHSVLVKGDILESFQTTGDIFYSIRFSRQTNGLFFRDIDSLLQDPLTAKTPRLALIKEAGLTHAAGIHFNRFGVSGVVVYYFQNVTTLNPLFRSGGDTNIALIKSEANISQLQCAAETIGLVLASIDVCHVLTALMDKSADPCVQETVVENSEENKKILDGDAVGQNFASHKIKRGLAAWWSKCLGASFPIPPGFTWTATIFTFFSAFISLILLTVINKYTRTAANGEPYFDFGATVSSICLQTMLTSAPAAQPRTIVLGFLISGAIGNILMYIPDNILPYFVRLSISSALAMAAMVKLSIPCPAAGAFSMYVAQGRHTSMADSWRSYGLTVAVNIFLIVPAILIQNLSKERQYPTYW